MGKDKVTIREVAREAGLSVASVSRVLTGSRPVRSDVAERVREAATRLDYRPDYLGRSLSLRSTSSIGLVLPDIGSPFFPALAQAIEGTLRAAGYSLLLMDAQNDPSWELDCVQELIARRVDGLLISPCDRRRSTKVVDFAASRVPVVQVDRYASRRAHQVVSDAALTVRLAVGHLASQGCRAFAFVGATSQASPAQDRRRSFVKQVAAVDPAAAGRVLEGDFTVEWGHEAAELLTRTCPEVDAVVCANDLIAVGVVQGLTGLGRAVPDDVAVTGCDDTFFASVSRPAITSVAQPVAQMASEALSLLTDDTAHGHPRVVKLAPALHVRASSLRGDGKPG